MKYLILMAIILSPLNTVGQTIDIERNNFGIEIRELDYQGEVTEVYIRAWDTEGKQRAFGKNGNIEIERVRIHNLPTLVPDSTGTITRTYINKSTGREETIKFRQDNDEALYQVLGQIIPLISTDDLNIIEGSTGRTTSVFYPDPSEESTSVDGFTVSNLGASSSWSANRDATSGSANDSSSSGEIEAREYDDQSDRFEIERGVFLFDTSGLPDTDIISSATLSIATLSKTNTDNDGTDYINIYTTTPATNTAVVAEDYDQIGTIAQATPVDLGAVAGTGSYTDFVFNGTGIGNISMTGISKFGAREGHDAENISITNDTRNLLQFSTADTALTTLDPKLTVVHEEEEEPVLGCTDPEASNYDPEATEDDDSCTYPEPLPSISQTGMHIETYVSIIFVLSTAMGIYFLISIVSFLNVNKK